MGLAGNSKLEAQVRISSLRKEIDYQNSASNRVSKPLKTKVLWAQRFFRNPNRKPFPWGFHNCSKQEGEGTKETLEEGIEMREEDMDCLQGWNSPNSKDTNDSEDDLSVPESENGKTEKLETEDIVRDVSKLFIEELEDNNQLGGIQVRPSMNSFPIVNSFNSAGNKIYGVHKGDRGEGTIILFNPNTNKTNNQSLEISNFVENEEDWGRGDDICGRPLKAMTHEEWKIINRVVEGVEMQ